MECAVAAVSRVPATLRDEEMDRRLRDELPREYAHKRRITSLTKLAVQAILARANALEAQSLPELPQALLENLLVSAVERSPIHVRALVRAWTSPVLRIERPLKMQDAAARMLAISVARNDAIVRVELIQTSFASEDGSKPFLQLALGVPITQNVTTAPLAVRPSSGHVAATHEQATRASPIHRLVLSAHVTADTLPLWRRICEDERLRSVVCPWRVDASHGLPRELLSHVLSSIAPDRVRVLVLARNLLGSEATLQLAQVARRFHALEDIDVSYNRLGGGGGEWHAGDAFEQLATTLATISRLSKLRMAGNALNAPRVRVLCEALARHAGRLSFLDLSGSLTRDGCLRALASLFAPASVCRRTLATLMIKGHSVSAARAPDAALLVREAGAAGALRFLAMGFDAADGAASQHRRSTEDGDVVEPLFAPDVRETHVFGDMLSSAFGTLRSLVYLDIGGVEDFVGCYAGVAQLVHALAAMPCLQEVRLAPSVVIVLLTGCAKRLIRAQGLPPGSRNAYEDGRKVWLLPHPRSAASSLQMHLDADATGHHSPRLVGAELDALWTAVQLLNDAAEGRAASGAARSAGDGGVAMSRVVKVVVGSVAWPALAELFQSSFGALRILEQPSCEFDAHAEDATCALAYERPSVPAHAEAASSSQGWSGGEYLQLSDHDD